MINELILPLWRSFLMRSTYLSCFVFIVSSDDFPYNYILSSDLNCDLFKYHSQRILLIFFNFLKLLFLTKCIAVKRYIAFFSSTSSVIYAKQIFLLTFRMPYRAKNEIITHTKSTTMPTVVKFTITAENKE